MSAHARNAIEAMARFHYRAWYKEDIAPHLTLEQKKDIALRISKLTLERAIWMDYKTNHIKAFPELAPYSNTKKISGLQLVSVMECIVKELQGND